MPKIYPDSFYLNLQQNLNFPSQKPGHKRIILLAAVVEPIPGHVFMRAAARGSITRCDQAQLLTPSLRQSTNFTLPAGLVPVSFCIQ